MIYAETERLTLRSLEKSDLPRIVEMIGAWDVARWLTSVPYPYTLKDAEDYYAKMTLSLRQGTPEYFLLQRKSDQQPVGSIGLHAPYEPLPQPGEHVIGYWLGREYWGQGLISEALSSILLLAFARPEIKLLTATTDPANLASQNVLRKAGFASLGISPRRETTRLRGGNNVMRWELTRAAFEMKDKAA